MTFILTKFIYPLKEKLNLNDEVYFDNPRTKEEIKEVVKLIRGASPFPPNDRLAGGSGFITIEFMLEKFKEKYFNDVEVSHYINNCKYKDSIYKLASMWVILRYEKKINNTGTLDINKACNLVDTLTILSFDTDRYYDFSVLISDEFSFINEDETRNKIRNSIIENLVEATNKKKTNKSEYKFSGFISFYQEIYDKNNMIKDSDKQDLINYVMECIGSFRKNHDLKMKFVSIVSIIELLLTHSPNYSRFNVEESISKQFNNKIALICYLNNKSVNYENIIKESKLIYSIRSDIAHGNFDELNDNLSNYFSFCKKNGYSSMNEFDKIHTMNILIKRVVNYMVIVFGTYLTDYKVCEIIKNI